MRSLNGVLALAERYRGWFGEDWGRNGRELGLPGIRLIYENGGLYFLSTTALIILILLLLHFHRLDRALMILLTPPFALLGGLWAVWLADYNLSVAVGVGFIALGGIAAETAVIMLLYIEAELPGFARTAALFKQLDLVISVDTALVHLAGSLGIPTWVMLGHHADWRWHTTETDSRWYPGLRIFRPEGREDWPERIDRVRQAFVEKLEHSNH